MKTTKRALFSSVIALILCFSMLVGTTFAWFTDEVKSANNIITAGNLDVNLYWSTDAENWTEVNEKTNVFDKVDLWEPGKTQVVYLKIVNEGTLALKYQLGVNVASETAGTRFNKETGDDEAFKLSDFIKYRVMDYTKTYAADERDVAIADAEKDAGATKLNEAYNSGTIKLEAKNDADTDEKIVTVVVYMPTTVGNEANYKTGTTPPTINLGINLFATQVEGEFDSFDDKYDEDAIYFDALVKTDAELLAAIQDPKVEVIAIDENVTYNWGNQSYENSQALLMAGKTFYGVDGDEVITFEGYGSANPIVDVTLKNLTVADKTVGDNENAWEHGHLEFAGLYAENVVFMDSVMLVERPASATYSLRSTTVQKVTDSTLINCTFNNTIKSWYALWVDGGDATIRDCSFTGTRAIKAHEAYGSEIGTVVIANNEFVDLSEKPGVVIGDVNADTSITLTNNTFAGTQAGDQGNYKHESDSDVTTFNFVDENNTLYENGATPESDLKTLLNTAKSTVYLSAGTYSDFPNIAEGVTIIGGEGVVFEDTLSGTLNNVTIKNVEISAGNAQRWAYAKGTLVFEDCTFEATSVYAIHYDGLYGANITYKNCKIVGWVAIGGGAEYITFDNCEIYGNGRYGLIRLYSPGTIKNCTFDVSAVNTTDVYQDGIHAVDCKILVEDCKNVNGDVTELFNISGTGTIIADGAQIVASSEQLSDALASGGSVALTGDVQFNSAIKEDSVIDLNGNTFEATGTVNLTGNADLTMTNGDYVVNGTYGHIDVRPDSAEGSTLLFENIDFSYNKLDKTFGSSTDRLGTVVEICAAAADAKSVVVFRNCTFDNAQVLIEGMSGKTGIVDVTFENCTFKALTSSAPIYVQNYVTGKVTVTGCTFNLECTSSTASAISVSPSSSTVIKLIASNNTINAVAATASGENGTVEQVKVNGTPANIKFISAYDNATVTETGTVKSGIAG